MILNPDLQFPAPPRAPIAFLVGAGFSKQVNSEMPITKELGKAVAARAEIKTSTNVDPERFEEWLSDLISPPPWIDRREADRRELAFKQARNAIEDVLETQMRRSYATERPDWLKRLVYFLYYHSATVITLNYDTMIETAAVELNIKARELYSSRLTLAIEPNKIRGPLPGEFKLLKLHGSVNWFESGEDTIEFTEPECWGPVTTSGENWQARLVEHRPPLIVPPLSNKGGLFRNHALRDQWIAARAALASCNRLVVIGCSFSAADTLLRKLLAESVKPEADLVVLDIAGEPAEELKKNLLKANVSHRTDIATALAEICPTSKELPSNEIARRIKAQRSFRWSDPGSSLSSTDFL